MALSSFSCLPYAYSSKVRIFTLILSITINVIYIDLQVVMFYDNNTTREEIQIVIYIYLGNYLHLEDVCMNKAEKLGNNIRCLRVAYGETQEQLGNAINVAKNTVSSYEKGRTEPDKNVLSLIAVHYMISVEELLSCDFSGTDKITFNQNKFWEQIDIIFPVTSSENARKNEHFNKAYSIHRKFFDELQKQRLDNIDKAMICFEEYINAYDDENSREEAAANFIGLWYLLMGMIRLVPKVMKNQPAALTQIKSKNPKIRRKLENIDPDFEKDANDLVSEFDDLELNEMLSEFMKSIKKSGKWYGLGDYYLALQFFFNLADNDMTWEFNRRIGVEMLIAFASVGNPYAAHFLFLEEMEVHKL